MADPIAAEERTGSGGLEPRVGVPSEIARRRAAKDLWISWSHVYAAAAGLVAASALAFVVGVTVGERWATPATTVPPSLTAEVPRDELLRLLARIDGNAHDPSAAITFPDALRGQGAPQPDAVGGATGPTTFVAGGAPAVTGDALPGPGWTVVLATTEGEPEARAEQSRLAAAGIASFVAVELVEGVPRYRVGVGHHRQRDAAVEAARLLSGAGTPVVEALQTTTAPEAEAPAPVEEAPPPTAEEPEEAPPGAPTAP
jgi:hypothetical protein